MNFKDLLPFLSPAAGVATGKLGGLMPLLSPGAAALGIGSKGKGGGGAPAVDPAAVAGAGGEAPPVEDSLAGIRQSGDGLRSAIAANDEAAKHRGPLANIGDFIKSDDGKAALLRAGAEMLRTGSVGGGIMAGADYTDHLKADRARTQESALDRAIRQQQVDQTGQYQDASLGLQREELGERRYQYDNPSGTDRLHETGANFRHTTPSGNTIVSERGANYRHAAPSGGDLVGLTSAREGRGLQRYMHDNPSADNVIDNGTARYVHDTPSGDGRLQALGIGSKSQGTRKTEYTIPGETTGGFMGIGGTTSPDKKITEETPLGGGAQIPGGDAEVRYDGQGLAYVKGPDGTAVRAPKFDRTQ